MPETIAVPDLSDNEQDALTGLLAHLEAKAPRNLLRASYYDGKRAIRQVGSVIPPQYYRLGIVLGWSTVDGEREHLLRLDRFQAVQPPVRSAPPERNSGK